MLKLKAWLLGFLQAMGVLIYCGLISGLFKLLDYYFKDNPPQFLIMFFMLILLVISAGVTGALVFGYPAYLALNKRIKEALKILGHTFLYCIGFLFVVIIILIIIQ